MFGALWWAYLLAIGEAHRILRARFPGAYYVEHAYRAASWPVSLADAISYAEHLRAADACLN